MHRLPLLLAKMASRLDNLFITSLKSRRTITDANVKRKEDSTAEHPSSCGVRAGWGVLLYYGWKKRGSKVGQAASSIGASILFKALEHPYAAEILGPFQNVIKDQLTGAQKLLT